MQRRDGMRKVYKYSGFVEIFLRKGWHADDADWADGRRSFVGTPMTRIYTDSC
jgi:hypothetical protein